MNIELKNVKKGYGIIGLMFKTKIKQLYSFHLGAIDKSLHTMFCFCPMECICLQKNNYVVEKIHMPPWKIFECDYTTTVVIEGPVGAFKNIKIGDHITF